MNFPLFHDSNGDMYDIYLIQGIYGNWRTNPKWNQNVDYKIWLSVLPTHKRPRGLIGLELFLWHVYTSKPFYITPRWLLIFDRVIWLHEFNSHMDSIIY